MTSPLKASQVLALAVGAGFSRHHANVMTAVAWYESGWDPQNRGDLTLSKYGSVGLWQIFTGAHSPHELGVGAATTWNSTLAEALTVPIVNARAAHIVFQEQGYAAWSTYNAYHTTAGFKTLVNQITALKLTPVVPPVHTVTSAAVVKAEAEVGQVIDHNLCLVFVRTAFGLPANGHEPTAISAWQQAQYKHPGDTAPPVGVPVFWSGGSAGAGHVAVSIGDATIISSDIDGGRVGKVSLGTIRERWGLTYLGWTEDLEGHRVYGVQS